MDITAISFSELHLNYNYFLKKFLTKSWTINEADAVIELEKEISCNKRLSINYKKLADLLTHVAGEKSHFDFLHINVDDENFIENNTNKDYQRKVNKIYHCINKLRIHSIEN